MVCRNHQTHSAENSALRRSWQLGLPLAQRLVVWVTSFKGGHSYIRGGFYSAKLTAFSPQGLEGAVGRWVPLWTSCVNFSDSWLLIFGGSFSGIRHNYCTYVVFSNIDSGQLGNSTSFLSDTFGDVFHSWHIPRRYEEQNPKHLQRCTVRFLWRVWWMLTHTIVEDLMVNEHETISQAHYGNMLSRSHSHLKKEAWLLGRMKVFLNPR